MATAKRLPPMPNVKDLLGTHEQQSTSLLRGVDFEHVVDVLEECPVEELKKDDILISPGQPRPGRVLTQEDIDHYQRIVVALNETIRIMKEIDEVIEEHGGWPDAFAAERLT